MFVFSFLFFLFISWFLPLCYPSVTYSFFFEPISGNIMLLPTSLILWQNNYLHSSLVLLGNSSCDVCTSCAFVHRFPLLLRKRNCQSLSTASLLISFIFLFIFEESTLGKGGRQSSSNLLCWHQLDSSYQIYHFLCPGRKSPPKLLAWRVSTWLTAKCFSSEFLFIMFITCLAFFYDIYSWPLPLAKGLDYRKINDLTAQFNFSTPLPLLFWIVTLGP